LTDVSVKVEPEQGSASPTLLFEQARMLVETEEARFAGVQSRATTILSVAGVIIGLGAAVATGLDNRDYGLRTDILGLEITLAHVFVWVLLVLGAGSLLRSGFIALGLLQKRPEPESADPSRLIAMVGEQFPSMVDSDSEKSARTVLLVLAERLKDLQVANQTINVAMKKSATWLVVAVASWVMLTATVMVWTTQQPREVYLVREGGGAR
jgi:hypothetical protein